MKGMTKIEMKQSRIHRGWIISVVAICCCVLMLLGEAKGQDNIYSIDAFVLGGVQTPAARMGVRMSQPTSDDSALQAAQIATFRNLYYDLQPTRSYDKDGTTLDLTNGKLPLVISVHPNAFGRLESDFSNHDFSVVKMIIIQEPVSGALPKWLLDTSKERFPSLDYVVVNNQTETRGIAESQMNTMASSANEESRNYLIFVYNNLTAN